jgi:polar amino acid transport system substrate-binding protein
MRAVLVVLCLAVVGPVVAAGEGREITLYTYHNHPPFVTRPGEGLSHDLVELLNREADGAFRFTLKVVPRSRLNMILKRWITGECQQDPGCSRDWLVPWVNPKWGFGKAPQQHLFWMPLLQDSNVIISSSAAAIDYQQPSDLDGKRFAGIAGHRYVGIDERVEAGKITRIDGNRERSNLLIVSKGRVDATLLPDSTYRYYLRQDPQIEALASTLYRAEQPHHSYLRNLMAPADHTALVQLLERVALEQDAQWRQQLGQYGLL